MIKLGLKGSEERPVARLGTAQSLISGFYDEAGTRSHGGALTSNQMKAVTRKILGY